MIKAPEHLPDDIATLKAALSETRGKLSGGEALIAHLQLVIKKMKREAPPLISGGYSCCAIGGQFLWRLSQISRFVNFSAVMSR